MKKLVKLKTLPSLPYIKIITINYLNREVLFFGN